MARSVMRNSGIYGIEGSWRDNKPYTDLAEVLNSIGVMSKRTEIPYAQVIIPPSRIKQYNYRVMEYYVPKDWRDRLYEDLETGHYYIVSPDPENEKKDPEYEYSWIAFRVTGITDGIRHYYTDDSGKRVREILYHSGTFIDLLKRCNLNEILDTLAKNGKPIVIKVEREWWNENLGWKTVCRFDI